MLSRFERRVSSLQFYLTEIFSVALFAFLTMIWSALFLPNARLSITHWIITFGVLIVCVGLALFLRWWLPEIGPAVGYYVSLFILIASIIVSFIPGYRFSDNRWGTAFILCGVIGFFLGQTFVPFYKPCAPDSELAKLANLEYVIHFDRCPRLFTFTVLITALPISLISLQELTSGLNNSIFEISIFILDFLAIILFVVYSAAHLAPTPRVVSRYLYIYHGIIATIALIGAVTVHFIFPYSFSLGLFSFILASVVFVAGANLLSYKLVMPLMFMQESLGNLPPLKVGNKHVE